MPSNRQSRREKKRQANLSGKNSFGKADPTPMLAVKRINNGGGLDGYSGQKRATS